MPRRCAYGLCNSDSRYGSSGKRPRPDMEGVTFYPFPVKKYPERRRIWAKNCGREGYGEENVRHGHYVCSKHFVERKPTMKYPDPIPCNASEVEFRHFLRKKGRIPPIRQMLVPKMEDLHPPTDPLNQPPKNEVTDIDENPQMHPLDIDDSVGDESMNPIFTKENRVPLPEEQTSPPVIKIVLPTIPKSSKPLTKTASTQTNIVFDDLHAYTDGQLKDQSTLKRSLLKEDIGKTDDSCKFYTGLTILKLVFVFNFIKEKAKKLRLRRGPIESTKEKQYTRGRILDTWEELLVCLIRLRRGLQIQHLADMFAISIPTVSRICFTYTQFLRRELEFAIQWPSREQVHHNPPPSFKYFPRTRALIDCSEFFIQRPSLPSSQRKTWSSYKHHNTFKLLVATTPRGTFSFVSDLWTGNVSDRRITQLSGFLDKVEFQDDIMADRGFIIRDLLALKGATLNIPPFAHGRQLSSAATTKTRRIARARIYVEMAIGRLKCFHILNQVIPLSLKSQMNDIVRLCAILCNLDNVLVKST